jgi:glycosyltransferase involved in cell wall biosynthesis
LKVLLRAPLLTNSGYGVHSRQVFEWLNEKKDIDLHVECLNWGMTPWIVNKDHEAGLIGKIMECSKPLTPPYDISFQLQLPDEWDTRLGKINIGMSAVVETDRCNPRWVEACNNMDHVIVPSNFTKAVLKRSGMLKTKVTVIPEWYNTFIDDETQTINDNKELNKIKTDFNFLIISQLNSTNAQDDRKNIFNTIKWLCEEFRGDSSVGIILKTNSGKGTTIDKKITKNILAQMLKAVKKKNFPKVYLVHGNMKREEVASFYKRKDVKCYVSATRGEGYGLPLVDAAAAGIPVIATNWSGHLDFLKDKFTKINYTLTPIRKEKIDNRIFLEGFRWAEPDENDFKQKVRKIYNNFHETQEIANLLKIETNYNFSKIAIQEVYNQFYKNLLNKKETI